MQTLLALFTFALALSSWAADLGVAGGPKIAPAEIFDSGSCWNQVKATIATRKTAWKKGDPSVEIKKEDIPPDTSEIEMITRLVYAESMATKCNDNKTEFIAPIAAVIFNRIRAFEATTNKKIDATRRTVFGQGMFASSLRTYDFSGGKAEWEEFLCPSDPEFFKAVKEKVAKISYGEIQIDKYKSATHYYLHNHSGSHKNHPWGKKAKLVADFPKPSAKGSLCLGLYDLDTAFLNAPY